MWWKYLDFIKTTELSARRKKKIYFMRHGTTLRAEIESRMENVLCTIVLDYALVMPCSLYRIITFFCVSFISNVWRWQYTLSIFLQQTSPKWNREIQLKIYRKKNPFQSIILQHIFIASVTKIPSLLFFCIRSFLNFIFKLQELIN